MPEQHTQAIDLRPHGRITPQRRAPEPLHAWRPETVMTVRGRRLQRPFVSVALV
jgi:hypothetical protein